MALRKRVTLDVSYDHYPFKADETPWQWAQRVTTELGYGSVAEATFHTDAIEVTTAQDRFRRYLPVRQWAEIVADIAV